MNLDLEKPPAAVPEPPIALAEPVPRRRRARRWLGGLLKLTIGVLFTQSLLGSLLILGWTYRLMQRTVYRIWWRTAPRENRHATFTEWVAVQPAFREHANWPNWIVAPNLPQAVRRADNPHRWTWTRQVSRALFRSLGLNFKLGAQAAGNTALLILPGCGLMLFSWYAGWQNSFHKGYELAVIGPALGWCGYLLLIAALFYVPMAQARQAVTGDWRAFYQFGLVWRLIRERWPASLGLALAYNAAALPVTMIKTLVYSIPSWRPEVQDWTNAQALAYLNAYFFWWGFLYFMLFVALRLLAARLYATGVLVCLRRGAWTASDLAEDERGLLGSLALMVGRDEPRQHRFVRLLAWLATRPGRLLAAFLVFAAWFSYLAVNIYVAEFLNFHPVLGWLNPPLIHLPFFRYVPAHLESFGNTQIAPLCLILFVALIVLACRAIGRSLRGAVGPAGPALRAGDRR